MNEQCTMDILYSKYITTDEKAQKLFLIFDKDKSGKINIAKLIMFKSNLTF